MGRGRLLVSFCAMVLMIAGISALAPAALADEDGDALVVTAHEHDELPGCTCTASPDGTELIVSGGLLTGETFEGVDRAGVRRITFSEAAYLPFSCDGLFEGFSSLERFANPENLDGSLGVWNMRDMFRGCRSLVEADLSSVVVSSTRYTTPARTEMMGVLDVAYQADGAFEGCASLRKLVVGDGWRAGESGRGVSPWFPDEYFDFAARFPVKMAGGDGTLHAAGDIVPDGAGIYTVPAKRKPTIALQKKYRGVSAAAAKKKSVSFKIGATASSGGKITYKVVKRNPKITFKNGKVTLKRGTYTQGKMQTMKVKVACAAKGEFSAGSKTFTLAFRVK